MGLSGAVAETGPIDLIDRPNMPSKCASTAHLGLSEEQSPTSLATGAGTNQPEISGVFPFSCSRPGGLSRPPGTQE